MLNIFAGPVFTNENLLQAFLYLAGLTVAFTCLLAGIYFITYKILSHALKNKDRAKSYASITIVGVVALTYILLLY